MKYFEYLDSNKRSLVEQIELIFTLYQVQPVGSGYIDCIIMRNNLKPFIDEISAIGVIISDVSWWCYFDPLNPKGCPHGMGGPKSEYYDGWFSELQNDMFEANKEKVDALINSYDKRCVKSTNMQTLEEIENTLKVPFRYTHSEYIPGNECVVTGIWLHVPDDWKRY
ncbi:hypothetical protein [Paenibacillus gansuensis]|uniref:Uncharacterized protein n=1 Tax=Paenibacillus gansuensis TaxID=306542 RepID=A0ABW5PGR3_9BACL